MFHGNINVRSFVKEKTCQISDLIDYALHQPYSTLRKRAHLRTVDFIENVCIDALPCRTSKKVLNCAIKQITIPDGSYCEFGVFKGGSIRGL